MANGAKPRLRTHAMQLKLPVFTVHRNEVFRLYQIDDELQLFLAGVTADMEARRSMAVFRDCIARKYKRNLRLPSVNSRLGEMQLRAIDD